MPFVKGNNNNIYLLEYPFGFLVHGICQALSAGNHNIALYAEIHSSQFRAGYATQASRLFVDELGQGTFGSGMCYSSLDKQYSIGYLPKQSPINISSIG